MILNPHFELEGRHARISPSKYHWVNYDEDKFVRVFTQQMAAKRGDMWHEYAKLAIKLRKKQARTRQTVNMYINDAISYRMSPEQPLKYSEDAFGTADALSFEKSYLRIHDLKTGMTPTKVTQLEVYAALFCLEYDVPPHDIGMEFRIYQNDDVAIFDGDPVGIEMIMHKIQRFSEIAQTIRMEEML